MEDRSITAGELIKYLQNFPEDSDVDIVVVDTHGEKKIGFTSKEVVFVTDMDNPMLFINIDRNDTLDITKEFDENTT